VLVGKWAGQVFARTVGPADYGAAVILDQSIPGALLPQCTGLAAGATCDAVCEQTLAAFDGSELAADFFGFSADRGVSGVVAQCRTHIPTTAGLSVRGALLLTRAGRLGIGIGYGRVVEPAGRQYVLVADPPDRYELCFDSGRVLYTLPVFSVI
jgi:hypothetical protein